MQAYTIKLRRSFVFFDENIEVFIYLSLAQANSMQSFDLHRREYIKIARLDHQDGHSVTITLLLLHPGL